MFKSGFVSIIGRTNSGKSTLINYLVNEKIAITTFKPQTTRTAIKGIVNTENSQIIFIDTPGIHKPKNKFGKMLIETATNQINDSDVILFLIDANKNGIEEEIIELLKKENKKGKVILLINKIDLVKKEKVAELIDIYKNKFNFKAIIPISSLKKKGKKEIIDEIEKLLPEGPAYYDEEEYTDQTERQIAEETIREKALKFLNEEIPHGLYVEVEKLSQRKTTKNENIYDIEATIYCERNSHKGIIIGKNGEMLKKIGQYAREDLEKILNIKINLKLWVKVQEKWQDNNSIMKKFKM